MDKSQKYVMVDIDGVLNSSWSFKERKKEGFEDDLPHPFHIRFLNKILEETDAKIVISSTWRLMYPFDELVKKLEVCGVIPNRIIDKTPIVKMSRVRGREIRSWLETNNVDEKDIVILDDENDMDNLIDRLVKTEFKTGLSFEHYKKAVEMLK